MKTDRELLELAAKAAGIQIDRSRLDDPMWRDMLIDISNRDEAGHAIGWNPLTDDGDALRLAVQLGLNIHVNRCHPAHGNPRAEVWIGRGLGGHRLSEGCAHDETAYQSATRRAIVRAAAAIGEGMK